MGYRAKVVMGAATRLREGADADLAHAEAMLSGQIDATNAALTCLNQCRVELAAGPLARGIRAVQAVGNIKPGSASIQSELFEYSHSPSCDIEGMQQTTSTALLLLKGSGLAVASGALGMAGAVGLATTVGAASTGTAIATLSGAAATNATLAWLGGGALSAGGAGMTGGMFALGGLFAGPAVAVAGTAALAAASKRKTEAEGYVNAVTRSVGKISAELVQFRAIDTRISEVTASLKSTADIVDGLAGVMEDHLRSHGYGEGAETQVPFSSLAPSERVTLVMLGESLKALSALLAVDVVAEAQELMAMVGEGDIAGSKDGVQ